MQTFLPLPDFVESAKALDLRRLGKQRVESFQILKALSFGPMQNSLEQSRGSKYVDGLWRRKTPWYNHPATQMWKGYEGALYEYLACVCEQWLSLGFEDSIWLKTLALFEERKEWKKLANEKPKWFYRPELFASHRANLMRKNPAWYGKFGWTESPDMEYWWPTKNGY